MKNEKELYKTELFGHQSILTKSVLRDNRTYFSGTHFKQTKTKNKTSSLKLNAIIQNLKSKLFDHQSIAILSSNLLKFKN